MGVSILDATFGDNIARRNVTKSLQAKADTGTLEVTANEELIPAFEVSQETKLDNADLADINKKAQEKCEGGADTACMQAAKAEFIKQKHEEKAKIDTSSSNIIAGRSLQVTYIDSKGVTRRAVVPDGQKFKLEDVTFTTQGGKIVLPSPWASLSQSFKDAANIFWWTLLFVFSVAAAYRVFKIYGNLVLAVFVALLAIILPLGGYSPQIGVYLIVVLYGFIEMGRMSKQKAMAEAPPAPPAAPAPAAPGDPLAAFQGVAGSVNNILGGLKGANPMAALQGIRSNPMAALGSFLRKR